MNKLNRRSFLAKTLSAAAALGCSSLIPALAPTARARSTETKPNIIFIFADDVGWGDLYCYGNPRVKTPYLDRLAAQGRLFTQFYVCSPVCSPSRVAAMTGRFPAAFDIHGALSSKQKNIESGCADYLPPEVPNIASLLKKQGYTTGHFGKWHLAGAGMKDVPSPTEYGFDEYRIASGDFPIFSPKYRPQSTKMVMDETWKFVDKNRSKPFFVNAWLADTHSPLNPSKEQMDRYEGIWWANTHTDHDGAARVYYGTVTEMDKQIGIFLDKLKAAGLEDNTIVIFSSDNGPEDIKIGEASHSGIGSTGPFRGRKRCIYEGGVRVPFIIKWPNRVKPGTVDSDSVLSAVDLLPTLASIAGADTSSLDLDGHDISPVFKSKKFTRTKPLFWSYPYIILDNPINKPPRLAIRDGKWKLLINPDMSRVELYDIPADPAEINNLAGQNFHVVKRLSQKLLTWYEKMPPANPDPSAGTADWNWPEQR